MSYDVMCVTAIVCVCVYGLCVGGSRENYSKPLESENGIVREKERENWEMNRK